MTSVTVVNQLPSKVRERWLELGNVACRRASESVEPTASEGSSTVIADAASSTPKSAFSICQNKGPIRAWFFFVSLR